MLSPLWMRVWMGAHPFPPQVDTPRRVEDLCRQLGIKSPTVLCISGDQAWHGAALVGWTPLARQLWIGAAVARDLPTEELDMVILHELAHLRRGHCWWRLAGLAACGGAVLWSLAGGWMSGSALAGGDWHLWLERGALLLLAAMILSALSWISRACELDADREACRQASRVCAWAADRPDRAADALVSALRRLHGAEADARRWYWLHPSLGRREQALVMRYPTAAPAGEAC
jgi:hypothetical protein